MSNYTHFSSLGYQRIEHQSRGITNPLGRMSPDDIEQKARDEQEKRHREEQERLEQERSRRKRASLEGFKDKFGGKMESDTEPDPGFIKISGTSINNFTQKSLAELVDTLSTNSKTIVWFYAPWCGHCKTFTQTFLDVEENLRNKVNFIMVNGDLNSEMARNYGIRGFPTFKFFSSDMSEPNGIEYNGPRTASGLISFLRSQ